MAGDPTLCVKGTKEAATEVDVNLQNGDRIICTWDSLRRAEDLTGKLKMAKAIENDISRLVEGMTSAQGDKSDLVYKHQKNEEELINITGALEKEYEERQARQRRIEESKRMRAFDPSNVTLDERAFISSAYDSNKRPPNNASRDQMERFVNMLKYYLDKVMPTITSPSARSDRKSLVSKIRRYTNKMDTYGWPDAPTQEELETYVVRVADMIKRYEEKGEKQALKPADFARLKTKMQEASTLLKSMIIRRSSNYYLSTISLEKGSNTEVMAISLIFYDDVLATAYTVGLFLNPNVLLENTLLYKTYMHSFNAKVLLKFFRNIKCVVGPMSADDPLKQVGGPPLLFAETKRVKMGTFKKINKYSDMWQEKRRPKSKKKAKTIISPQDAVTRYSTEPAEINPPQPYSETLEEAIFGKSKEVEEPEPVTIFERVIIKKEPMYEEEPDLNLQSEESESEILMSSEEEEEEELLQPTITVEPPNVVQRVPVVTPTVFQSAPSTVSVPAASGMITEEAQADFVETMVNKLTAMPSMGSAGKKEAMKVIASIIREEGAETLNLMGVDQDWTKKLTSETGRFFFGKTGVMGAYVEKLNAEIKDFQMREYGMGSQMISNMRTSAFYRGKSSSIAPISVKMPKGMTAEQAMEAYKREYLQKYAIYETRSKDGNTHQWAIYDPVRMKKILHVKHNKTTGQLDVETVSYAMTPMFPTKTPEIPMPENSLPILFVEGTRFLNALKSRKLYLFPVKPMAMYIKPTCEEMYGTTQGVPLSGKRKQMGSRMTLKQSTDTNILSSQIKKLFI